MRIANPMLAQSIVRYLTTRDLLKEKEEVRKLKFKATMFTMVDSMIYGKGSH